MSLRNNSLFPFLYSALVPVISRNSIGLPLELVGAGSILASGGCFSSKEEEEEKEALGK